MSARSLAMVLIALTATSSAAEEVPFDPDRLVVIGPDRTVVDDRGYISVFRRSEWSDFNGGRVTVDQLLRPDNQGRFVYRYEEQPRATRIYHEMYCASSGLITADDDVAFIGQTTGWMCTADPKKSGAVPEPDLKSVDWVTATAPSGRVPVGSTYTAVGYWRLQSSMAGARRIKFSVDNNRCGADITKHFSGAFSESTQIDVSCIIDRPRFVDTSIEVCIPKRCGSHRGTQVAQ